jgi:hypothetical protein
MTLVARLRLSPAQVAARERELEPLARETPAAWLKPGVLSANGVALAVAGGVFFLADGANHWERQYAGAAPPDPWLETWLSVLAQRQAEAAGRGIELWNVVIPEKQVVYPERRWPQGGPDPSRRPLQRILSRLEPQARLLYGEAALSRCKAQTAPAYAARDSHWSASGCLAVVGELVAKLAPQVGFGELSFAADEWLRARDLTHHFFDRPPPEPSLTIGFSGERVFDNRRYEQTGRHQGSAFIQKNPAAPDPRTVVVFGDSFSYDQGFAGALSAVFAEVSFVWSKSVDWGVVEQRRAQIVICEGAERFLVTTPTA